MPHFIIDCSSNVLEKQPAYVILETVFNTAESTNLFARNDIKVRVRSFEEYKLADDKNGFIHVFAYIMEGRTSDQKLNLSQSIVRSLKDLFPEISILSMNIMDFEKSSYCNKSLIQ